MFVASHYQVDLGKQRFPQLALRYNFADADSINDARERQQDSHGE